MQARLDVLESAAQLVERLDDASEHLDQLWGWVIASAARPELHNIVVRQGASMCFPYRQI